MLKKNVHAISGLFIKKVFRSNGDKSSTVVEPFV